MKKYLLLVGVFLCLGVSAYAQAKVTFSVDMSVYQKYGYFNPKTDTVKIAGDFTDWQNSAQKMTQGTGADTAKYTLQVTGMTAADHQYKYIFINSKGIQWEGVDNRHAVVGTRDTVIATVFFNNLDGSVKKVWFKVDMSLPLSQGKLTTSDTVGVTGDFTGWGTSGTGFMRLTKGASDSVYSGLRDSLHSGQTVNFKFIYLHSGVQWEGGPDLKGDDIVGGNRTYMVPANDSSTYKDFWDRTNPNVKTGSGTVNFKVDMSVMQEVGIFNNTKDSLQLRGSFNGWSGSEYDPPQKIKMNQNALAPNQYILSYQFTNEVIANKQYKYFVKKIGATGMDTLWVDGYERPVVRGGDNRQILFDGSASKDTIDWYDGVRIDWVIPTGTNLQVKFGVDMTPAMDAAKQAVPFDPANDTLYYIAEQPTWARVQQWYRPSNGGEKYLKLTRVGTSNIWSGTYTMKDPSFNAFEYRYAWQKGSDASWVFEPDGLGTFDTYRVRYVGQSAARTFPVKSPWVMPTDIWTNANVKTDQELNPYDSYLKFVGLKDENVQPITYSLSQNYPNPFNPSTIIKFSIQKAGLVTLKIYNILGQEVVTLVNKELKTGTYSFNFDASRLSSGVYLYSIQSGNFFQAKKMILMK